MISAHVSFKLPKSSFPCKRTYLPLTLFIVKEGSSSFARFNSSTIQSGYFCRNDSRKTSLTCRVLDSSPRGEAMICNNLFMTVDYEKDRFMSLTSLDTPLGPMIALADENALYLLEFADRKGLDQKIERLKKRAKGK